MRLIDADALKKRALRMSTVKGHVYMKAVGTNEIDKSPTVDAVPWDWLVEYAWNKLPYQTAREILEAKRHYAER